MILYLLVLDVDLFYCLRDNYIENTSQTWLSNFRNMPEIEFVMKMINLKKQPTVAQVKQDWINLKGPESTSPLAQVESLMNICAQFELD